MSINLTSDQLDLIRDLINGELEALEDMDQESKGHGAYQSRLNELLEIFESGGQQ